MGGGGSTCGPAFVHACVHAHAQSSGDCTVPPCLRLLPLHSECTCLHACRCVRRRVACGVMAMHLHGGTRVAAACRERPPHQARQQVCAHACGWVAVLPYVCVVRQQCPASCIMHHASVLRSALVDCASCTGYASLALSTGMVGLASWQAWAT